MVPWLYFRSCDGSSARCVCALCFVLYFFLVRGRRIDLRYSNSLLILPGSFSQMGSRRFASFMVYTTFLSTVLELVFFNIFFDIERYSGPYPQLGAVIYLYHRFTPRLYPSFFGLLGCNFSEKSLTYGLCAQVILFGGLSTVIPTFFGFVSGIVGLKFSINELPDFVYALGKFLGRAIVDEGMSLSFLSRG